MTAKQFLYGVVLLGLLYLVSGTTGDPDLWGHVRFGQDMLAQGTVRVSDTYSFTTDQVWINHEWLAEILFALAFDSLGPAGLNLLRILALACLLGLVWHASSSVLIRYRTLLVVACVIGTYLRGHPIRPQIFSLLMCAILFSVLKRADDQRSLHPLVWVPLVMAFWVNLHGGWIVGFGIFGMWCSQEAIDCSWRDRGWLALALGCTVVSTLLNPYGLEMWNFLASTVRMERPMIADWQPLYDLAPSLWMSWLAGFVVMVISAAHARSRKDWIHVGIVAILGVAALRVSRLDAFFALAAIFLAIRVLHDSTDAIAHERVKELRPSQGLALGFNVCVALVAMMLVPRATTVPIPTHHLPDREVAVYVREQKLQGNVLTWFTWGEYFIWHFGPDLKVSMDGRRETVYSPALISDHLKFYFGRSDEWRYADSLKADYIWIPKHLPVAQMLQLHGWNTLCAGQSSILLSRSSRHQPCSSRPSVQARSFPGL